MRLRKITLLTIMLVMISAPLLHANALGIGPPSFELNLQIDGSNSTTVYLLSDGLEGELIIGSEDLPFRLEPSKINMSEEDHYRPVELTFYGNDTLELGVYDGMVTFTAQTGGFVAVRIKIRAKINLLGEVQEVQEEEPEVSIEEESEAEIGLESEEEPETIVEEAEPEEDEPKLKTESEEEKSEEEIESEEEVESEDESGSEEPEPESQEMDYTPYIMGGAAIAALVSIVWWKRR